MIELLVV